MRKESSTEPAWQRAVRYLFKQMWERERLCINKAEGYTLVCAEGK